MANSIRTLSTEISPELLRKEILHTLNSTKTDARHPTHLAAFQNLETEWWTVHKQSILLRDAVLACTLDAELADAVLNDGSDEVAIRLDKALDGNRKHPVFVQHFGDKRPSTFKRPILGAQLDTMESWPVSLAALPYPTLNSYAPVIAAAVNTAKTKRDQLKQAVAAEEVFYVSGDYKKLVDKVNAARGALLGDAAEYAYHHPEESLPKDYAASFFLRAERERERGVAELDRDIEALEGKLSKLKEKRQALVETEGLTAEQRLQAEKQAKLAQLAEAQKQAKAAEAAMQALQAELAAMSGG